MYSSVQGSDVLKRPKDQSTVIANILANIHSWFSNTERQVQCWYLVRGAVSDGSSGLGGQWEQGMNSGDIPAEILHSNMDLDTDKTWKKIMFGNNTHFQM